MRGNWKGAALVAALGIVLGGCAAVEDLRDVEDPAASASTETTDPTASEPTPSTEAGRTLTADPSATDQPSRTPSGTATSDAGSGGTGGGSAAIDFDTAPSSYREAVAYVAEARETGGAQDMRAFATPEDIYCLMSSQYLQPACELPQGAGIEDAEACRNAMGDRVGRIELTDGGPRAVCNTDTIRDSPPEVVQPVGVVTNARTGLECAVADIGVTCVQAEDRIGFYLGMDSYATFG